MSRCTLRYLATLAMYVGVAICIIPYVSGKIYTGLIFLACGGALAICSGLVRCYYTEGDSPEQGDNSPPDA